MYTYIYVKAVRGNRYPVCAAEDHLAAACLDSSTFIRSIRLVILRHTNISPLHTSAYVSIRQHTSAYVSLRQLTTAYVRIRQDTSAFVSIRQHTSAYVG